MADSNSPSANLQQPNIFITESKNESTTAANASSLVGLEQIREEEEDDEPNLHHRQLKDGAAVDEGEEKDYNDPNHEEVTEKEENESTFNEAEQLANEMTILSRRLLRSATFSSSRRGGQAREEMEEADLDDDAAEEDEDEAESLHEHSKDNGDKSREEELDHMKNTDKDVALVEAEEQRNEQLDLTEQKSRYHKHTHSKKRRKKRHNLELEKKAPLEIPSDQFDTDLEDEHVESEETARERRNTQYDPTGAQYYKQQCLKHNEVPASFLINNLGETVLKMRYRCRSEVETKYFAKALQRNASVETLDVCSNGYSDVACSYLAELLKENIFITCLNISSNGMGPKSSREFAEMLEMNMTLRTLKLQANQLKDEDAEFIGSALKNNLRLECLDLSHNRIGDRGAKAISMGLKANVGIQDLDLSWNCIQESGCVALANALMINRTLEIIDLSWNGVGDEGCAEFSKVLRTNSKIKVIDLSNCRINEKGFKSIIEAIKINNGLESFLINTNQIGRIGMAMMLDAIDANFGLKFVSIEDTYVSRADLQRIQNFEQTRKYLSIMHSGLGGIHKKRQLTSVLILFDRFIKDHYETMIDLFNSLDTLGNGNIPLEDLKLGLKDHGLRLTNHLIDILLEEIDTDKSGTIEFEELVHSVAMAKQTVDKQLMYFV